MPCLPDGLDRVVFTHHDCDFVPIGSGDIVDGDDGKEKAEASLGGPLRHVV